MEIIVARDGKTNLHSMEWIGGRCSEGICQQRPKQIDLSPDKEGNNNTKQKGAFNDDAYVVSDNLDWKRQEKSRKPCFQIRTKRIGGEVARVHLRVVEGIQLKKRQLDDVRTVPQSLKEIVTLHLQR